MLKPLLCFLILNVVLSFLECEGKNHPKGTPILVNDSIPHYPDNRPAARYRLNSVDAGIVMKHGSGPDSCDYLGARDVWVWKNKETYYMHYDGSGPKGWLACLAISKDLMNWEAKGPVLDFGESSQRDCASASYGTTYFDGNRWHLFYLGTPHVTKKPDFVPAFPYLTMKAKSDFPIGPWEKHYETVPFEPRKGTYFDTTTSPGQIEKIGNEYLMFFSASTGSPKIMRTISLARTKNLEGSWQIDSIPMLPPTEQIENSSLYFDSSSKTWFLFTNHVGLRDRLEYTDAVWVYWSKSPNRWDAANKAVVLDASGSKWSRYIIGLPSVVKCGNRLALFYDGTGEQMIPKGVKSHMNRDIGLAWIDLPILLPKQ